MTEQYKFLLSESEMPKRWYNIVPDLPSPLPPPLNPQTMEPIGPEDLAPLFPMGLILQEVSQDSYIDIPQPVLDLYKLYRPSPLFRAVRLEKALGTNSRCVPSSLDGLLIFAKRYNFASTKRQVSSKTMCFYNDLIVSASKNSNALFFTTL